jgi:hypothetical protein
VISCQQKLLQWSLRNTRRNWTHAQTEAHLPTLCFGCVHCVRSDGRGIYQNCGLCRNVWYPPNLFWAPPDRQDFLWEKISNFCKCTWLTKKKVTNFFILERSQIESCSSNNLACHTSGKLPETFIEIKLHKC